MQTYLSEHKLTNTVVSRLPMRPAPCPFTRIIQSKSLVIRSPQPPLCACVCVFTGQAWLGLGRLHASRPPWNLPQCISASRSIRGEARVNRQGDTGVPPQLSGHVDAGRSFLFSQWNQRLWLVGSLSDSCCQSNLVLFWLMRNILFKDLYSNLYRN